MASVWISRNSVILCSLHMFRSKPIALTLITTACCMVLWPILHLFINKSCYNIQTCASDSITWQKKPEPSVPWEELWNLAGFFFLLFSILISMTGFSFIQQFWPGEYIWLVFTKKKSLKKTAALIKKIKVRRFPLYTVVKIYMQA